MLVKKTIDIIMLTICDTYLLKQSTKIAIVVGTILNIINQGDYMFNMMYENINYYKLVFTYIVPFCVSTYTAILINLKKEK